MASMETDSNGLIVLPRGQCLRLLRRSRIGRVVVSIGALPAAFPVNFALLDDDVVFRTAPGTKLSAAVDGAVVGFEVDRIDPLLESGWSVLIQGTASVLSGDDELERAKRLHLRPSAPGDRRHYVRIRSELISGRRFLSPLHSMSDAGARGAPGTDLAVSAKPM
jgi:nitroimidazol reductase NimA-like FMN-containing flavoprotein (pyridoxamine 5'-phosphate oxidase superfamily)